MSKKMNNEIKTITEAANSILRTSYMQKNESVRNELHAIITHTLISSNMYHGFNYYTVKNNTLRLAGKETSLVQFYIV